MLQQRGTAALAMVAVLTFALIPGAHARTAYCRPKTSLPAGAYQKTCQCRIENCDYLVCACGGPMNTSAKISACGSQSFSNVNGALTCD